METMELGPLTKDEFFAQRRQESAGLAYGDVTLDLPPSTVDQSEVDLSSRFSTNVGLKIPLVSSPMDTVTDSTMAIAMAAHGGLGIIHAGFSPEKQAAEVRRVKRELSGFVEDPTCVSADDTISDVLAMRERERIDYWNFPVRDSNRRCVGVLTEQDIRRSLVTEPVSQRMTDRDRVTFAKSGMTSQEAYDLMREKGVDILPLEDDAHLIDGLYSFKDVQRIVEGDISRYNVDNNGRLLVGAAVPTGDGGLERIELMQGDADVFVIDTARGNQRYAPEFLREAKNTYPGTDIVAGSVSNFRAAMRLLEWGADGIRVGQGGGSICISVDELGAGNPQLTAVYECAKAIAGRIPVCADGAISKRGHISIALAAGADSVMMGYMLAGTDESAAPIIEMPDGTQRKLYRGQGSESAMLESEAARARYSALGIRDPLAEGIEGTVSLDGPLEGVLGKMVMALRNSFAGTNSKNIADHHDYTRFIWRSDAAKAEGTSHDVAQIALSAIQMQSQDG